MNPNYYACCFFTIAKVIDNETILVLVVETFEGGVLAKSIFETSDILMIILDIKTSHNVFFYSRYLTYNLFLAK